MGGANQKNTALMLWDGGGEPTWYLVIVTGSRVGILNKVIMISPDNKEKEKKTLPGWTTHSCQGILPQINVLLELSDYSQLNVYKQHVFKL